MYTTWDIYSTYRKVQARVNNRGYRLPKDWNKQWEKFNDKQKENIQKLTDYFNTKWQDINLEKYFEAGFKVYKNFTYHQFLDKKVIEMYKRLDKLKKRDLEFNKKSIINQVKYLLNEVDKQDEKCKVWGPLKCYCRLKDSNYISRPIKDYIDNRIDTVFLTWLIYERFFIISDVERSMIPYVENNFRDNVANLKEIKPFLDQVKEKCRGV